MFKSKHDAKYSCILLTTKNKPTGFVLGSAFFYGRPTGGGVRPAPRPFWIRPKARKSFFCPFSGEFLLAPIFRAPPTPSGWVPAGPPRVLKRSLFPGYQGSEQRRATDHPHPIPHICRPVVASLGLFDARRGVSTSRDCDNFLGVGKCQMTPPPRPPLGPRGCWVVGKEGPRPCG